MSAFEAYRNAFANARLTRKENGVPEVKLHTNGDMLLCYAHTSDLLAD